MEEQIGFIFGSRGRHRHDVPGSPALERAQKWLLHHGIEHIHGPEKIDFEKNELVVLVVLRDGISYIKSFVEHYFALGAKHLVFLDTGSEDGGIEALKKYGSRVTVFRTGLPFRNYQISMRQYLVERFGRERWTLGVDIDELFDYPYSDVVSLGALLGYLSEHRYTAVVSYMLDMFPEDISSETEAITSDEPLKKLHRFYDVSDVDAHSYGHFDETMGNVISNEEIPVIQGGVQRRLFDISPLLTKHPLVFLEEGVRPMDLSEHWVGGARLADFTGLLLHYKLSASLYGLVRREIENRTYPNRHGKYDKYLQVLERDTRLAMKDEDSRELGSINELVGGPFMVVSKEYMEFVGEEDRKRGNPPEANSRRLMDAFFNAHSEVHVQSRMNNRIQQQVDDFADRARRAEDQTARARQQAQDAREQARKAWQNVQREQQNVQREQQNAQREQQNAQRAREQVLAVQSSRAWKMLVVLSAMKQVALDAKAILSRGLRRRALARDVGAYLKTRIARNPAPGPATETRAPEVLDREPAWEPLRSQGPPDSTPEEDRPPFFVVGNGKSGTTWLTRLLNSHPEILCRGEGRFFNREWHREDLREDADAKVPPRSLHGALYNSEDLRLWLERSPWSRDEDTGKFFVSLTRFAADYFLRRKLAGTGKRLVGDKTPFLPGANVVEEIEDIYPDAKVIHIIRDGRDVEVSWVYHRWNRATDRGGVQVLRPGEIERREAYENDPQRLAELGVFEEEELRERAELWRDLVGDASESGPRLMGGNYIEVRYESLLDDPAAETERLLRFLGVESGDEVVRRCVEEASFESLSGGRRRGEEDSASFFRKGIAGDWRNVFTERDKRIYKEAAGDLLIRLGYEKDYDW